MRIWKKNKAFTLIELLAVIVILAIIALIATPIVLNIIEKARKSAFQDSAYGLISAAKLKYTENLVSNTREDVTYTFPQTGDNKLQFSGSEPKGGSIVVDTTVM